MQEYETNLLRTLVEDGGWYLVGGKSIINLAVFSD